jgi:hypothetical protein
MFLIFVTITAQLASAATFVFSCQTRGSQKNNDIFKQS